jgi:phosphoserine phosphatase RsbU/P
MSIGRSSSADVRLEGNNVSRNHARVWRDETGIFVEDLGSSNGTFVNQSRIAGRTRLSLGDHLEIGSYRLRLESESPERDLTIQRQTMAQASNPDLFRENATQKLQAVLELAQLLAHSLETPVLLERVVKQLLVLFPNAERAMVISFAASEPAILALSDRTQKKAAGALFSRSVMRTVRDNGMAVLADDTSGIEGNLSLNVLGIRSLLCVPLQAHGGRVFGAMQLDRFDARRPFTPEDLHLLATVALQVSAVLENAQLHQELIVKERMVRELGLAREIQQAFLPTGAPVLGSGAIELHGELHPAMEVAGDFYDYLALDDSRLLLAVGDVSGKGMAAALFMTMVRALLRQLAGQSDSPAAILARLNQALARDNPRMMFVTLVVGICDVKSGELILARAGHPAPLLRRHDGRARFIESPAGSLLGFDLEHVPLADEKLCLAPGDSIFFYTDGITEAALLETGEMFGEARLRESFQQLPASDPLQDWCAAIRSGVASFSQSPPQDDLTLLVLRRPIG